jgi:cytochrome P450
VAAVARGLLWIRGETAHELAVWHKRAGAIPDAAIRADALDSISRKRDNAEGAALFAILPRRRHTALVRLLVAYQTMWDFLDSTSERGARVGETNGRQLHRALVDALDPQTPLSDYYRYHPWKNDGGYLRALVETCRRICLRLPGYRQVRAVLLDGVSHCAIQAANHELNPSERDTALRAWAARQPRVESTLSWFELTAAASAFAPHVLLALAAEPRCEPSEVAAVYGAYFPWMSLAIAMLDSYVDQAEDALNDSHSYIAHYDSEVVAVQRLAEIVERTVSEAGRLANGRRHVVIAAAMVAMYLSLPSANTAALRAQTRTVARAGGPLTRLLLSLAHVWRAADGRRQEARREGSELRARLPPTPPLPTAVQTYLIWRAPFGYLQRCRARYGSRFVLKMCGFPALVFLSEPAEIRAVLTAPADVLHPGEGGAVIAPIVGSGSFMLLDERRHLDGRKAVMPALHRQIVHAEAERVLELAQRAVASWPRDAAFALHPRLRALTLEVVLRRLFSWSQDGAEDPVPALREHVLAMLSVTSSAVFPVPALRHGPGRRRWERFLRDRAQTDELLYALIDERRGCGSARASDALAALLSAPGEHGSPRAPSRLRDDIMSLILAGHETTASQLSWAFQLLAHHPRAQRRLIEELDSGEGDAYLTATIHEVLRHRPVFLFAIPRDVKQPIEIGGFTYEPPAHLLACIYLLHHDPRIYPAPDEFRPERFLEGQPAPRAWMPWGGGRKRCPGLHMAMLEMKTVLRAVLAGAVVCPASRRIERPRWRSVIVTPYAGGRVVLRRRDRGTSPLLRHARPAVEARKQRC